MPHEHQPRDLPSPFAFGPFNLHPVERLLEYDGRPVVIGSRAFDILLALLEHPGEIIQNRTLLERAWPGLTVEEANLRVHIAALRRLLAAAMDGTNTIVNVPGRGYAITLPVRRGTTGLPAPVSRDPAAAMTPARRLFGRDEDTVRLRALLTTQRCVSLVGPGGVGKTALALQVASGLADSFADGLLYIDLADATTSDEVTRLMTGTMGAPIETHLQTRHALVVLDTCTHVLEAVAAISSRILSVSVASHLLLVGREPMRSAEECVYVLRDLELPVERQPGALQALAAPAVALFMASARAGGHRQSLSDGEAPIVASICRQLDGNPLAIEIVASRICSHGVSRTAELVGNPDWLLSQTWRGASPRHRTIAALLDWSTDLLAPRDRLVMGRLSALPAAFKFEAAEAVARDANLSSSALQAAMSRLLEHGLLSASAAAECLTYRFPNLVRTYARWKFAGGMPGDRGCVDLRRFASRNAPRRPDRATSPSSNAQRKSS
jgi:predicted ATPase/DNA-binding winged helix-turn-helix (wHTH) protein